MRLGGLEQVLGSSEARGAGVAEGVLLDSEDHIISAIAANIFLVTEDRLLTPRLDLVLRAERRIFSFSWLTRVSSGDCP